MREILKTRDATVYALEATHGSYAYFIDQPQAILVDTSFPGRGPAIWKELGRLARRLDDIVITHYDVDHIGSLPWLAEHCSATIWLPAGDAPYILGERRRPGLKRWVAALMPVAPPPRHTLVSAGQVIGTLTAVASPGHTPGHLAYRGPGCLFVGDAMGTRAGAPVPTPRFLSWDGRMARESMATLTAGFEGWILPAHGEPIQWGQEPHEDA